MTDLFVDAVPGDIISSSDYNSNWNLTQNSFSDLGPLIISGMTISAGAGLAVTVATGIAIIGARVESTAPFSIAGLADNTTNHLYLQDNGIGTSNTSGTQPADTVKLGTCVTAGGVVTSTNILRDSGRQAKVRTENLVPGGPSAGNPGSINLAAWATAAANSVTVYGTLPAGAMAGTAIATKTTNYTLTNNDGVILADATGGSFTLSLPAVSGRSGRTFRIKKIDGTANTVTIDPNGAELIDGLATAILSDPNAAADVVCNGSAWYIV